MSSSRDKKKKKRSRHDDDDDDEPKKKSLVDYSKVSSRPDNVPRRSAQPAGPSAGGAAAPAQPKMSAQMESVIRLMTGQEERTIAQKLADSNRPTWEQYKKDNHDKLNLEGVDQQKMEEYRQELDQEREKRLARGTNHGATKKKKKKKKDKKKKRRKKSGDDSDDDDDSSTTSSSSSSDSDSHRKRKKKHKSKKSRKKHKKKKKKKDDGDGEESDGSHYRLSKFFTAGSDSDDSD